MGDIGQVATCDTLFFHTTICVAIQLAHIEQALSRCRRSANSATTSRVGIEGGEGIGGQHINRHIEAHRISVYGSKSDGYVVG